MKGIQYVIDDTGEKKAVIIDLAEWGELWEDFWDVMMANARKEEPRLSWEDLKSEMEKEGNKIA